MAHALCPAILRQAKLIRLWVARCPHSWDSDGGRGQLSGSWFRAQGPGMWAIGARAQHVSDTPRARPSREAVSLQGFKERSQS